MAMGRKTGGRRKGSLNKPKVATDAATPVAAAPGAAGAGGAPDQEFFSPIKTRAKPAFPKYRIVRVDSLIPNERNPRIHTRESVDALARHIGEVGWTNPILVAGARNHILAGHRRRLAAIKREMEYAPVIDIGHLSAKQRRAYIIWDNKSTIDGSWDRDLLDFDLGEMRDDKDFDVGWTGFSADEISKRLDDPGLPAPAPKRRTEKFVTCPECQHEFSP
jgi:hypothetical protein